MVQFVCLGVSLRVLLDEISPWIGELSRLPLPVWVGIIQFIEVQDTTKGGELEESLLFFPASLINLRQLILSNQAGFYTIPWFSDFQIWAGLHHQISWGSSLPMTDHGTYHSIITWANSSNKKLLIYYIYI